MLNQIHKVKTQAKSIHTNAENSPHRLANDAMRMIESPMEMQQ